MCTIMGCSGAFGGDGTAWLASTSDNPYREGPRKPMVFSVAANGRGMVHTPCLRREPDGSFTDLGSDRGLNNAGLAWTRSWVVPDEEQHRDAPSPKEWFLRLGSECASVAEAVAFIERTPKREGCQGNYLLADAFGGFACVEAGYATVRVAVLSDGDVPVSACRANVFTLPAMTDLDISATANPAYASTSAVRKARAEVLLQEACGLARLDRWKSILADTENLRLPPATAHGPSICSAGTAHGTVSAEIIRPADLAFWYTYGWPDPRAALGPEYTGEPLIPWGTWRRFSPLDMEPGAYTDWFGNLTPLGRLYFRDK